MRAPAVRSGVNYPSALTGHHQVELWFISIRDYLHAERAKEGCKLFSRGTRFNKQVAGGTQLIDEGTALGMADHKPSARPKHACRIAAGLSAMLPYMPFMKIASTLSGAKVSETMSVW